MPEPVPSQRERQYERGMQEGLDLRDQLREQLSDRDQDLKILGKEIDRLKSENEALKRSWNIDAEHRDACYAALKAVWDDMRSVDKHYVPDEVIALVQEAIGDDLDPHDPAFSGERA